MYERCTSDTIHNRPFLSVHHAFANDGHDPQDCGAQSLRCLDSTTPVVSVPAMSDDDDMPITLMVAKRKARQITRRSMRNRQVEDEEEREKTGDEEQNDAPRRRRSSRIKSPVLGPEKPNDASEEEDDDAQLEEQGNEDITKEKESTVYDTAVDDATAETPSHERPEEKDSDDSHDGVVKSADEGIVADENDIDMQHDQPVETPLDEDASGADSTGDQNVEVDDLTGIADRNEAVSPMNTKEAQSSSEEERMEHMKTFVADDAVTQVKDPKSNNDEEHASPDDADPLVPVVDTHVDDATNTEQAEPVKSTETGGGEAAAAMEIDTPEYGSNASFEPLAAPPADTSNGHDTETTDVMEQPAAIETVPTDALTQAPHTAKITGPELCDIGPDVAVLNPKVEEATIKISSTDYAHEVDKSNARDQLVAQMLPKVAEPPNNADKASGPQGEVSSDVKTNDSTQLLEKKSAYSVVDDKTAKAPLNIVGETPETVSDQDLGYVPMDIEPVGEAKELDRNQHDGASIGFETKITGFNGEPRPNKEPMNTVLIDIEPVGEEKQKEELDPDQHDVASIGCETSVNGEPRRNKEPLTTVPIPPMSLTFKPPTAEETVAVLDVFPDMLKRKNVDRSSCKRPKKRHRQHLCIKIAGIPKAETGAIVPELKGPNDPSNIPSDAVFPDAPFFSGAIIPESDNEDTASLYERELEVSLAFFSDTHEDQDPAFIDFQKQKEKQRLMDELADLKRQHEAGVTEINELVSLQLAEKQASTLRNMEILRNKAAMEEERDLQQLRQIYEEKAASNNKKINHGIKQLTNRQSQEMQKAHSQHRLQAQQRGVSEQVSTTKWQQIAQRLEAKHQQTLAEFNAKGEEMKKKFEAEYEREKQKYVEHHEKRKQGLESTMQKVFMKNRSSFQQKRQLCLKRLALKLRQRRDDILVCLGERGPANSAGPKESEDPPEKTELRTPTPIDVRVTSNDESEGRSPGAATRSAHRKSILGTIHKQLSVEIHNEGLWISTLTEKGSKGEGDKLKTDSSVKEDSKRNDGEFIPWSVRARTVLQSIIVGEIPLGYGTDRFDFGDAVTSQGGHIRCVVVDLRTSEKTASEQRAAAMKEQEAAAVMELEQTVTKLTDAVAAAEKQASLAMAEEKESTSSYEKALKDVEKAKSMMQQLRNKFKHLLMPGKMVFSLNIVDAEAYN